MCFHPSEFLRSTMGSLPWLGVTRVQGWLTLLFDDCICLSSVGIRFLGWLTTASELGTRSQGSFLCSPLLESASGKESSIHYCKAFFMGFSCLEFRQENLLDLLQSFFSVSCMFFMFLPLMSVFVILSLLFPVDFPTNVTKFVVTFMIYCCQIQQIKIQYSQVNLYSR